jgi:lipopolysaccharide heptosyltransferase II
MAQVLKKHFPAVHISMLIRRYTSEIVQYHPAVDQMLFYDSDSQPLPFFQFVRSLRSERIDVVFQTNPRFRIALMMWFAGIPIRVGTGYRWYSFLFNRKVYEHRKDSRYHELEYNLHLLKAIDCPLDNDAITPSFAVPSSALERVRTLLAQFNIPEGAKIITLHPGSGGSAREWSPKKFGELGKKLSDLRNVYIFVTGSNDEGDLAREILEMIGTNSRSLVNMLNLTELAALIKTSSLFVSNSTGPIHIAAAVGTPVIGLYPQLVPMSATRWGPYTNRKVVFTPKQVPIDCRQCAGEAHGRCVCMEAITVDEVADAAIAMFSTSEHEAHVTDIHLSNSK